MKNELRFPYKTKHRRINLILGLSWFIIGFIYLLVNDRGSWLGYMWLVMGVIYITIYYLQHKG